MPLLFQFPLSIETNYRKTKKLETSFATNARVQKSVSWLIDQFGAKERYIGIQLQKYLQLPENNVQAKTENDMKANFERKATTKKREIFKTRKNEK